MKAWDKHLERLQDEQEYREAKARLAHAMYDRQEAINTLGELKESGEWTTQELESAEEWLAMAEDAYERALDEAKSYGISEEDV